MTKIEEFVSYASKLPAGRLDEVEDILTAIMSGDEASRSLSTQQEAEISKRLSETRPDYAELSDVEAIFQKPFRR